MAPRSCPASSDKNVAHNPAAHVGQAEVAATVEERQLGVIEAELGVAPWRGGRECGRGSPRLSNPDRREFPGS